jgi:hypothetical protein
VAVALTNLKVTKGTAAASIKLSVDLYDFGHSVNVSAPPASKTVDGAKLLTQLLGGLGVPGG